MRRAIAEAKKEGPDGEKIIESGASVYKECERLASDATATEFALSGNGKLFSERSTLTRVARNGLMPVKLGRSNQTGHSLGPLALSPSAPGDPGDNLPERAPRESPELVPSTQSRIRV